MIRHRRRLFFPRALVEHAQHGESHGLNPGLDGRLRHRREQGRVVARQLRTFALAGGSDALRLVDADPEEHRGYAGADKLRIIFAGRDGRLSLSPNAAFSTFSAVATRPGSLITALMPSVIVTNGSGAFDMAATAFAVRSTPASILARTSGLKLRMVPVSVTSSGMMFAPVPPWIEPMLTTPNSAGSFSRLITL